VIQMVFSGIFRIDSADYENTRDALEKLKLNDSAFTYERETSQALGFGSAADISALAHGDRAATARARIEPLAHHHRALRNAHLSPDVRRSAVQMLDRHGQHRRNTGCA